MKKIALLSLLFLSLACVNREQTANENLILNRPEVAPKLSQSLYFVPDSFRHTVAVIFEKDTVRLSELPDGVSAAVAKSHVAIRSSLPGVEFILQGASDNASFELYSEKSPLVTLAHLRLFSHNRSALSIASPQIVFMQSAVGTLNYIMDGVPGDTVSNVKKAAAVEIYGSAILCGSGYVAIRGERKMALRTTGTLLLDDANVAVEMSRGDALVADSGFIVRKGNIHVTAFKDAIKSKAGNVVVLGGNIVLHGVGEKGDGIQARNIYVYGGNISTNVEGNASRGLNSKGSVYLVDGIVDVRASGNAIFSPKKNDYTSGACIKSEADFYMRGGYVSLNNSGVGGKGINCNGLMQIDGGTLLVCNSGNDTVHPLDRNAHTSAKGIKCDSAMLVKGGKIEVLVFGKGERCEGLEAKYDMTIKGDETSLYVYAYDDAINSGGNLLIDGGNIYAYSVANDGIDSNAGIAINGGVVIANGGNSPEQGIDTDYEKEFSITGGTVVTIGGTMGPSPCLPKSRQTSQAFFVTGATSLSYAKYATLLDDENRIIAAYLLPRTINGGGIFLSTPQLRVGGEYSFLFADTLLNSVAQGNGLYTGGIADATPEYSWMQEALLAIASAKGTVTSINPDTLKNVHNMMPPPPPPGGFLSPADMPPPPTAGDVMGGRPQIFMQRESGEGYGLNNLPGR